MAKERSSFCTSISLGPRRRGSVRETLKQTAMLSRRGFLKQSAAACTFAGPAGNCALAAGENDDAWSFPLLGDLHFDRVEHHDHEWLAREHPGDVSQVENYSRITREMTPRLMARVRDTLAELAQAKTRAPFVLQLGDLLEGLCGSEQLAALQAREGIDFVRQAKFSAPLVLTKGNHDITGPGAVDAYRRLLLPFMAQQTQSEITEATFTRRQGGTVVAFYDAYDKNSLDWFAKTLDELRPQRLIVAVHPPVVPYNARSNWHMYSSPKQQAQRERLLALLGRHRAIVLSGHLHKYSLLVRRTDHGPFVQLAISSVAATSDGKPRDERRGVEQYGPDLVELEPRHAPETVATRRELLAAERPYIERFEYADTWGHAVIHVGGSQITAQIYHGLDAQPWKKADLTALLS
jgi:calcineurin-like phosphoesterase family protein